MPDPSAPSTPLERLRQAWAATAPEDQAAFLAELARDTGSVLIPRDDLQALHHQLADRDRWVLDLLGDLHASNQALAASHQGLAALNRQLADWAAARKRPEEPPAP